MAVLALDRPGISTLAGRGNLLTLGGEVINKELLRTKEVAGLLDVHLRTVQRWVKAGYFPNAFKAGSYWRIPRSDVAAIMDAKRRERQGHAPTLE